MARHRTHRPWTAFAAGLGLLALIAAACGGDGGAAAPTARAGRDRTVAVGDTVTLNGGASRHPEGDALSFSWSFADTPPGSRAVLQDAQTPSPSFTPDVEGAYRVRLTVSDGARSAQDTLTVTATTPGGDEPSTWTPRTAADDVEAVANRFYDVVSPSGGSPEPRDHLNELQRAASELEAMPEVHAVEVRDAFLSATVLLETGLPIVLFHGRPVADPASLRASVRDGPAPAPRGADDRAVRPAPRSPSDRSDGAGGGHAAAEAVPVELPASKRAVLATVDGGRAQADRVGRMLESRGYEVSSLGASLADMRQYQDIGVLYLDTHGAAFQAIEGVGDDGPEMGEVRYALQTSTEVALSRDWFETHEAELVSGELVISIDASDPDDRRVEVAITERFIAKHWDLAGGLAFIHACALGADTFRGYDPSAVQNAILESARSLVAFDDLTATRQAGSSIRNTFSLLLGTDTWRRPWHLGPTHRALKEMGLDTFTLPNGFLGTAGTEVRMTVHGSERLALRPAIERIEVQDNAADREGELRLRGQFGSSQGHVFLRGTELDVASWTSDEIVAQAPLGRSGRVYATVHDDGTARSGDEIRSNGVELTRWNGKLTVLLSDPAPTSDKQVAFSVFARFRADVHPTRDRPTDSVPEYPETVTTHVSPSSTGELTASGHDASLPETTWTGSRDISWILSDEQVAAGEPAVPALDQPGQISDVDRSFFGGRVRLRPRANEAEACLRLYGLHTETMHLAGSPDDEYEEFKAPLRDVQVHPDVERTPERLSCLTLELPDPDDMTLAGRTLSVDASADGSPYDVWLSWSDVGATHAP